MTPYMNHISDYQRNQMLAQQAMQQNQFLQMQQFNPRGQRSLYSVHEVSSVDDVMKFRIEPNTTYIFLVMSTGAIYLRQIEDALSEPKTYAYVLSDDEPLDAVSRLERRIDRMEEIIGGMKNVQSKGNVGDDAYRSRPDNGRPDSGIDGKMAERELEAVAGRAGQGKGKNCTPAKEHS